MYDHEILKNRLPTASEFVTNLLVAKGDYREFASSGTTYDGP